MTHPWSDLRWWNSGERQAAEEKIHDLTRAGNICTPELVQLYKALRATPEANVRVAIIGQDPYPTPGMATGVAFSVARTVDPKNWPQTLRIILNEYCSDLHYPQPSHGDLSAWTRQGVLLWNAIPSCQSGRPLSNNWDEWRYLTGEIVERLNTQGGTVFVFLGSVAASYSDKINLTTNRVIKCSHPSPRGNRFGNTPFTGSRLFSTINATLVEMEKSPINWELTDEPPRKGNLQTPVVGGGAVLPNLTGAQLGGLKRTATSPNIYTSLAF
jgi:uracil-DNA glycosylase